MALFQRATADGSPDKLLKVYKDGRQEERARAEHESDVQAKDPALAEAYKRGRHDEKARRRRSPLIALVVLLVAAVGGTALFLAAREGSFSAGGTVVDRQVTQAAAATTKMTSEVSQRTGDALTGAGDQLKSNPPSKK